MPKIIPMPKALADLIAAGEIVERPASVVKELLENSIDAGAKKITAEIRRGGITYIRITDDGGGIARDDVRNAFVSHATSKLRTEDDLQAIGTLGFRGEALASIAAVARVDVMTRTAEDTIGTHYQIEGGEETLLDDAGCPAGTTIVVRNLFYNTPARMKFLKKDVTEANAVASVVDRIALSHPEISIRFIREDKQTLLTPGDGKPDSAIYAVFGREFLSGLIPTDYSCDGVRVQGYISKPSASRANRTMQFFFLNGRFIKTGTGAAALSEGYKHAIMVGKFPACVLNITVPNHAVDVNVHPAKIEVRFENERAVFNAVYYAVKNALEGDTSKAHPVLRQGSANAVRNFYALAGEEKPEQVSFPQTTRKSDTFFVRTSDVSTARPVPKRQDAPQVYSLASPIQSFDASADDFSFLAEKTTQRKPKDPEPNKIEESPEPAAAIPDFRVIGELFRTYILVEVDDKLWVIDKHAAHERMLYEQLKSGQDGKGRQILLSPVTVTLRKEEYDAVLENREMLLQADYCVEDFGTGTVAVTECPLLLDAADVKDAIEEFAVYLCSGTRELISEKTDWIYHNTACRAAIKGGDFTGEYELRRFTEKLLSMPQIRTCPHGRPVMIEITRREMEKSFGRG